MDQYRADLHIHSRHSRATSKQLTPRNLAAWAEVKGLSVIGTGDFTHPGWLEELTDVLEEDGTGFLKLKDAKDLDKEIPWLAGRTYHGRTRFMLQAEISSIYKRGGKVRKIHTLVYLPDLGSVERLNRKLDKIGNLKSDGRPILGLDARHLLEIVLETEPRGFIVPAHIWTPWFSLFGSKSGFDSIEECFGELSKHVFALETGLSSDPEMNWLWSALDRFALISNSDAHSGEKLAREANIFSGEMSFDGIRRALEGKGLSSRFLGTLEFFPEEGKYHLDGHRKCGVMLEPRETRARGGLCPVCGKPLTVGVLSRVVELADRTEPRKPDNAPDFTSLIPLAEMLSEILSCGPATKKVRTAYGRVVSRFGSELAVLLDTPTDELERAQPLLGAAVERMRRGSVHRDPGFDGQFGVIHVFSQAEKRRLTSGGTLIDLPQASASPATAGGGAPQADLISACSTPSALKEAAQGLNPSQQRAVDAGPHPMLVLAGPGTGKTHTLMGRIRHVLETGATPSEVLAVTFTRRAAEELRRRLTATLDRETELPRADTLHALAFEVWEKAWGEPPVLLDEESARRLFAEVNAELSGAALRRAWADIGLARERIRSSADPLAALPPEQSELAQAAHRYAKHKESWNLVDYTDLLVFWLEQIEAGTYKSPFTHLLVDEVQDLTPLQLTLLQALCPGDGQGFFAIGDPKQSIYGFRGAGGDPQALLAERWPQLEVTALGENYRSAPGILDLSAPLFPEAPKLAARRTETAVIRAFAAPTAPAEASWVAEQVRGLLGSTSSTLAAEADDGLGSELSPGEIAVLVRLKQLAEPLRRALARLGVPVSVPEEEAFWNEPRARLILGAAGRLMGMAVGEEDAEAAEMLQSVPEKVLAKGPLGLAAYLEGFAPFDRFFFKSRAFRQLAKGFESHGGWVGLINHVHLGSELEMVAARAESVQIMTLHAAKGLEFEAVLLPALEDGLVPFAGPELLAGKPQPGTDNGRPSQAMDMEEERRLFYVGLTRAKRMLYLSHAGRREMYGKELRLPASRFLEELPDELVRRSRLVERTRTQQQHLDLL